jgi:hypothetical protein
MRATLEKLAGGNKPCESVRLDPANGLSSFFDSTNTSSIGALAH